MLSADYQKFDVTPRGIVVHGPRMLQKLHALEPTGLDFSGKTVLDVGCDHGFWCFFASEEGADEVLGVDRGRNVKGEGFIDLVERNRRTADLPQFSNVQFDTFEAGKNWWDLGPFNVVLLMSLYHHVYQNTGGDHKSIWHWLWRQTNDTVIWENPTSARDVVVKANVGSSYHDGYSKEAIKDAALEFFSIEYEGPAEHEPFREIWLLKKKKLDNKRHIGKAVSGAGGASKAFLYNDGARISELESLLGDKMVPGSLNVVLSKPFDWGSKYFRGELSDVVERGKGLNVPWGNRPVRLYPVVVGGFQAYALRFEGEQYPENFVELVSSVRLRDHIDPEYVELWQ